MAVSSENNCVLYVLTNEGRKLLQDVSSNGGHLIFEDVVYGSGDWSEFSYEEMKSAQKLMRYESCGRISRMWKLDNNDIICIETILPPQLDKEFTVKEIGIYAKTDNLDKRLFAISCILDPNFYEIANMYSSVKNIFYCFMVNNLTEENILLTETCDTNNLIDWHNSETLVNWHVQDIDHRYTINNFISGPIIQVKDQNSFKLKLGKEYTIYAKDPVKNVFEKLYGEIDHRFSYFWLVDGIIYESQEIKIIPSEPSYKVNDKLEIKCFGIDYLGNYTKVSTSYFEIVDYETTCISLECSTNPSEGVLSKKETLVDNREIDLEHPDNNILEKNCEFFTNVYYYIQVSSNRPDIILDIECSDKITYQRLSNALIKIKFDDNYDYLDETIVLTAYSENAMKNHTIQELKCIIHPVVRTLINYSNNFKICNWSTLSNSCNSDTSIAVSNGNESIIMDINHTSYPALTQFLPFIKINSEIQDMKTTNHTMVFVQGKKLFFIGKGNLFPKSILKEYTINVSDSYLDNYDIKNLEVDKESERIFLFLDVKASDGYKTGMMDLSFNEYNQSITMNSFKILDIDNSYSRNIKFSNGDLFYAVKNGVLVKNHENFVKIEDNFCSVEIVDFDTSDDYIYVLVRAVGSFVVSSLTHSKYALVILDKNMNLVDQMAIMDKWDETNVEYNRLKVYKNYVVLGGVGSIVFDQDYSYRTMDDRIDISTPFFKIIDTNLRSTKHSIRIIPESSVYSDLEHVMVNENNLFLITKTTKNNEDLFSITRLYFESIKEKLFSRTNGSDGFPVIETNINESYGVANLESIFLINETHNFHEISDVYFDQTYDISITEIIDDPSSITNIVIEEII